MSFGRCGYSDDLDQKDLAMWRGHVMSAIRGKRGQRLLKECLAALDALPEKTLIHGEFATADGQVCALGAVGKMRNLPNLSEIDSKDHDWLAEQFDVATCLIQEIEFENDESWRTDETPEQRFIRVRAWLVKNIKEEVV